MTDLNTQYTLRASTFAVQENNFRKRGLLFSAGRLIIAGLLMLCLWKVLVAFTVFWVCLLLIGILLFMIVVWLDAKANKKQQYFKRLKVMNEKEMSCLTGDCSSFERGDNYESTDHPFTGDLDIFGNHSLFQLINRTCTTGGTHLLVKNLQEGIQDQHEIIARQQAVRELANLVDFRQEFAAIGQQTKEAPKAVEQLLGWLNSPMAFANRPFVRLMSFMLPAITPIVTVLAINGVLSPALIIASALINLAFLQFFHKDINKVHAIVSHKQQLLEKYSLLWKRVGQEDFIDASLQSVEINRLKASKAIHKLSVTIGFFDQRLNDLVAFFTNGFLLLDLHCIVSLDKWKIQFRQDLPQWLENLFLLDMLNALANFAYNHPDYVYPTFSDSVFIQAEALGHPLIKSHTCVTNDFSPSPNKKVIVLTGANMSGKSTFLRSLGVNLVLAALGAPVFARYFCCNLATIYSGMRVTDSLGQDASYFHAELKRLGVIMRQLRAGKKIVVFLDEILKGTNSADKLHGSVALVEEFLALECFCIIATHDLALGELENKYPDAVSNYCFESELRNNELHFDYQIKKGIAKNKNATFLMRHMGVIK